jgi:hypothetical protein
VLPVSPACDLAEVVHPNSVALSAIRNSAKVLHDAVGMQNGVGLREHRSRHVGLPCYLAGIINAVSVAEGTTGQAACPNLEGGPCGTDCIEMGPIYPNPVVEPNLLISSATIRFPFGRDGRVFTLYLCASAPKYRLKPTPNSRRKTVKRASPPPCSVPGPAMRVPSGVIGPR